MKRNGQKRERWPSTGKYSEDYRMRLKSGKRRYVTLVIKKLLQRSHNEKKKHWGGRVALFRKKWTHS